MKHEEYIYLLLLMNMLEAVGKRVKEYIKIKK